MSRQHVVTATLSVLAALAGLVVAGIVTLNLHILSGVADGYMASPAQVLEHSGWLLVVDILTLVAAPVLAVVLVVRLRRRGSGTTAPRDHGRDPARR